MQRNTTNNMTTTIQQCAIAYSTHEKIFCVTSPEIAQAMLFMGNAYGFNRVSTFPQSSVAHMRDVMEKNEFKSID